MPNRDYYAIYDGIDQQQLLETLNNVLVYCSLQFVSLLVLVFVLKRMLGLSPMQQLAFVLEKQVDYVQISLVFWLFYNVQSSLQHLGKSR
jgi:DNA integrity scanning protein DisA with diadenylate cyclase activity